MNEQVLTSNFEDTREFWEKDYSELKFTDDFLFCKILQSNPDICHELLEISLDIKIKEIIDIQKQYAIQVSPDGRGVRFDVRSQDDEKKIYDIEMQTLKRTDWKKRRRFYQSMLDAEQLDRGSSYDKLRDTYIIFICTFNIHPELDLYRYTFQNRCSEELSLKLEDGSHCVYLCAKGSKGTISTRLKNFLNYVASSDPSDEFTERIQNEVQHSRVRKEWRQEFMMWSVQLEDAFEKCEAKGEARGIDKTIRHFIEDRLDDHASDEDILSRLIRRFELSEEDAQKMLSNVKKNYTPIT